MPVKAVCIDTDGVIAMFIPPLYLWLLLFISDKEEEQMLTEWFSVIHERDVLVRRDTELVYL